MRAKVSGMPRGQSTIEYVLIAAVLVLGLCASLTAPSLRHSLYEIYVHTAQAIGADAVRRVPK